MPKLFSSLSECLGFSQMIISASFKVRVALSDISFRFPIGVATICRPKKVLLIYALILITTSCTTVNISKQTKLISTENKNIEKVIISEKKKTNKTQKTKKETEPIKDSQLIPEITLLLSNSNDKKVLNQFVNVLELAVYQKKFKKVTFDIKFFDNKDDLNRIINNTKKSGKIYIGPIKKNYTDEVNKFCNQNVIFFAFSSDTSHAKNCVYLINFFPQNELEQLFQNLDSNSKVALLYPENSYGYMINSLIDNIANNSDAFIVNRSSYKNDLSNVRDSIKELGKYELRKYEIERQKQILTTKKDEKSKRRLLKLKKLNTTTDYDFTHVLIADYGLNLLQVAPLLPYYDIDPNIVQFMGTGVIDNENFFTEPSLQGTIFPGVEKNTRSDLENKYSEIYEEKILRISTLPFDLVGLLNYIFLNQFTYLELVSLLNDSQIKFEGVDGEFYFKNNLIERDLDILKILNGRAARIN